VVTLKQNRLEPAWLLDSAEDTASENMSSKYWLFWAFIHFSPQRLFFGQNLRVRLGYLRDQKQASPSKFPPIETSHTPYTQLLARGLPLDFAH
jgi:hypothetical protein